MSMQPLDPLNSPLTGRQLIEASAGTGKTYTIAILFLRLLIEARLPVDQVLVVTFTEAATEELRERIRNRVREALDHLRGLAASAPDPVLQALLDSIEDKQAAQALLADALVRMDEAAVFTIHGFCGRMLRDNAFDSGMPFEVEFITDEQSLRHEILCDFWRIRSAQLDWQQTSWLLDLYKTPDTLLKALTPVLPHTSLQVIPPVTAADRQQLFKELDQEYQALVVQWQRDAEAVEDLLRSKAPLNRRSYSKRVIDGAMGHMQALVSAGQCPLALPDKLERFGTAKLIEMTKAGEAPPSHPLFDQVDQLMASHQRCRRLVPVAWLADALEYLHTELGRRKQQQGQLYFDDLLRGLADGLEGATGERLAAAIRTRFPVAMIDEFQDTDPLQYNIFSRIYQQAADTGLFMIGDPKQAIYSFRGADIFTYMQARGDTEQGGRQFTLDTNWRSSSDLVTCINTLFGRSAVSKPFIYEEGIVFTPVQASSTADQQRLRVQGSTPAAMRFWLLDGENDKPLGVGLARQRIAAACAEEIAGLLQLAGDKQATIGGESLQARDIAVLVRAHSEAELIQQALAECGVASVTQARSSVYESQEALDLLALLKAIAEPEQAGQLRAALVSDLLGYSLSQMAELLTDEDSWDALQLRFHGYRSSWQKQGLMVAMQQLLHDESLPQKLLGQAGGERRMTNLMHLAELLQSATMEQPGMDTLIHWLERQLQSEDSGEASELRLESDEGLVQILTIHKSKGLEFPVVFLPFPWVGERKPDALLFHAGPDKALTLDLGSEQVDRHRLLAQREELAERLRLFYVAVTRAKQLCVMSWGNIKGAATSAPAWLLHQAGDSEPVVEMPDNLQQIRAQLQQLADDSGGRITVEDLPEATGVRLEQSSAAQEKTLQAAVAARRVPHDWRQVSYSGLTVGMDSEHPDHDAVDRAQQGSVSDEDAEGIFRFPRGPRAGTFIHSLLEHMDFGCADEDKLNKQVREELQRHGFDDAWLATLKSMLRQVVGTELDEQGLRLDKISKAQRCDEMAFTYPLARLSPTDLQGVLKHFQQFSSSSSQLQFDPVQGLMRGFIDLVFEYGGRFYLVDYKSNHLGNRPQDYATPALGEAMRQHQYDLQYLIYTVALHRYLATRIVDYDYEQHFGGVYYLFLRGMRQGSRYGIYHDRPALSLVQALDQLFAGKQRGTA